MVRQIYIQCLRSLIVRTKRNYPQTKWVLLIQMTNTVGKMTFFFVSISTKKIPQNKGQNVVYPLDEIICQNKRYSHESIYLVWKLVNQSFLDTIHTYIALNSFHVAVCDNKISFAFLTTKYVFLCWLEFYLSEMIQGTRFFWREP